MRLMCHVFGIFVTGYKKSWVFPRLILNAHVYCRFAFLGKRFYLKKKAINRFLKISQEENMIKATNFFNYSKIVLKNCSQFDHQ